MELVGERLAAAVRAQNINEHGGEIGVLAGRHFRTTGTHSRLPHSAREARSGSVILLKEIQQQRARS